MQFSFPPLSSSSPSTWFIRWRRSKTEQSYVKMLKHFTFQRVSKIGFIFCLWLRWSGIQPFSSWYLPRWCQVLSHEARQWLWNVTIEREMLFFFCDGLDRKRFKSVSFIRRIVSKMKCDTHTTKNQRQLLTLTIQNLDSICHFWHSLMPSPSLQHHSLHTTEINRIFFPAWKFKSKFKD